MSNQLRYFIVFLVIILLVPVFGISQGDPAFNGKWTLIPDKSTEIDLYGTLSLEFQLDGSTVTIIQTWGTRRSFTETLVLKTGGAVNIVPINNRVFPTNVFMGLSMPVGDKRQIKATWENNGKVLRLEEQYEILSSQGKSKISSIHIYEISSDKETITYTIHRSTRKTGPEIKYLLKRAGLKEAYFMKLEDNWEINGKLPEQAFLISLQGVANMGAPRLYFIYPENWAFTYTPSVFKFYKDKRNFTFKELKTLEEALRVLKEHVKGYVLWDKSVRTSLIVAFTVAGLERAVVVSEELLPIVEEAGLKPVEDFRGKFAGKSDTEIYTWAYNQYWNRCSKEFIIWMGGEYGKIMKPGVADWGIYKKAFFNDLSTKESDVEEYTLAKKLLSEMKPMSMVMGWHSYGKDLERDHVKLVSSYGHRVEGLHTLPNLSFSSQVPPSPGFKFKNNHNIVPGKDYMPEKKVYITCVQTDGLGLGAWLKPGRGEIPYAWEAIMNYVWLAPAMMEYFYSMATPNDYFIGCLSGPGYIYPKAVPKELLPPLIREARELMKRLDLNVFEIMDYSEGATVEGNTELTKAVVDTYYEVMPDVLGFLNGYAPSFTFTVRDEKPLISYDYYLSPTRAEADAVADLEELASINKKRPYFLLVHVRESSNIKRVKSILDKLGPEFELVPLDIFLKMAGKQATFKERFLEKNRKSRRK
ncbi:MAG: GxGYxYP family putative glycoside hydrolase [Acidobacteriota bacterium]|nr:GxGYxYP family putative glycoside hydrolase [Acidobacteriota bacterium]